MRVLGGGLFVALTAMIAIPLAIFSAWAGVHSVSNAFGESGDNSDFAYISLGIVLLGTAMVLLGALAYVVVLVRRTWRDASKR